MSGSTLRCRAGGNGEFTVTAAADNDVARVDFSGLGAGWFGGGSDATAPFTAAYGFSLAFGGAVPADRRGLRRRRQRLGSGPAERGRRRRGTER